MLNIIAFYIKLLYAIIDTLYKITTSRIKFAKTHHFETFPEYRKFCFPEYRKFCWGITILSHSVSLWGEMEFCFTMPKSLWGELQFCLTVSKILLQESQFCVTVSKILRQESQFCLTVPKIVGYFPCIHFLNFTAVFLFNVIFFEYFDYFVSTNILKHQKTQIIRGVLKLSVLL